MAKWVLPEGRKPLTADDLADLTRRLADTAIERNCRCEELEAALQKAFAQISDLAAKYGQAQGALEASEMAGVLDGWIRRAKAAGAERDSLKAKLARDARLPRSDGVGGWTLPMDLLRELESAVLADGWGGCTAEATEIIALEVERRILARLREGEG